MNTNKKQKNKYLFSVSISLLVMALFFLVWQGVKAVTESVSISTLAQEETKKQEETQQKIEELQKRADIYKEIIDIKRKQGESLNNQLEITDSNIAEIQAKIDINKQKIDDYNSQINRIAQQIKEKDALMESQKKILAKLIQSYYEINLANPLIAYLTDGNIASFMVKKDRVAQTSDRINGLVSSVKKIKEDFESQNIDLNRKKSEVVAVHSELRDQGSDLESIKDKKENLIAQTKGEEARYAQLLKRVEAQKQELLDIDQYFIASGLSVDSYPKPPSALNAPLSWYYSQKDSRWGNMTIGNSNSLMKAYGCAVTSVAMVFTSHGKTTLPGKLAKEPIFSWDLIAWPQSWPEAKLTMNENGKSHGNISWSVIDAQLAKGNPVIVYIGRTQGSGGHYVVIHHKESKTGKYVVHDPYFGPNIYLDTTRALVGAMGVSSSTKMDQMIIYN